MQPKVMLYDEPTSALDPRLVDEVFNVMRELEQREDDADCGDSRFAICADVTSRALAFEDGKATRQSVDQRNRNL